MPEPITYPFTDEGVRDALAALGPHVAETLAAMGIKGTIGCAWNCPLARYLLGVIEGADDAAVEANEAMVGRWTEWTSDEDRWREQVTCLLSNPVQEFVLSFDMGEHPGLVGGLRNA